MIEKHGFICPKCNSTTFKNENGSFVCTKCKSVIGSDDSVIDKTASIIDDTDKE